MKRASGLLDVSPAFKFENQTSRPGNAMNSGDRAQRCLEGVSGWIREDVQRGGMGDKARMVGEGISYQAEGLYFGEIVQIQGF